MAKKSYERWTLREALTRLRRYLVTGLLILLPLVVTLAVVKVSVDFVNRTVGTWLPRLVERLALEPGQKLDPHTYRYFLVTGYVVVLAFTICTGMIASWAIGRRFIAIAENMMARIPFINKVYLAVRQIRDALVQRKGTVFLYPVLVEYPRKNVYVIGFVTAERCDTVIAGDYVGVFIPTTPNPTSGYLVFILREEIIRVDMTVEDAMKLIISGAAYLPEPAENSADTAAPPQAS